MYAGYVNGDSILSDGHGPRRPETSRSRMASDGRSRRSTVVLGFSRSDRRCLRRHIDRYSDNETASTLADIGLAMTSYTVSCWRSFLAMTQVFAGRCVSYNVL